MAQLQVPIDDSLMAAVKAYAAARTITLRQLVTDVLYALTDMKPLKLSHKQERKAPRQAGR
jgi:hypothetical protein